MELLNKLKGTALPKSDSITEYKQLPGLVNQIGTVHREKLEEALGRHAQLQQAWNVIQDSAHPTVINESSAELDDGRKLMVKDIISAVQTGELSKIQAA